MADHITMQSVHQAFVTVPAPLHPKRENRQRRARTTTVCNLQPTKLSRRQLFQAAIASNAALYLNTNEAESATLSWNKTKQSLSSTVFSVIPTSISNVNLIPHDVSTALETAQTQRALFLGEHHNSLVDHALQARIIESLAVNSTKPIAVGLECVQQKFQSDLDDYISGKISEFDLYSNVEWETRWVWPYELYLPVLRICRQRKIPLVALSMDFETLSKLRKEGGVANLSKSELRAHVGDPRVFADIAKENGFKTYINECITPSYVSHVRMGLLNETQSFGSFYSSRVLRDEAMATRTVRFLIQNPNTLLVCLMGGDHVKFEYGVKKRVQKQLAASAARERLEALMKSDREIPTEDPVYEQEINPKLMTVMLNPAPADAFDPRDGALKLEMSVDGDPIPIADYLWFSSAADAKPRRKSRERVFPPVDRLTSL